jgi:hypothetical protein
VTYPTVPLQNRVRVQRQVGQDLSELVRSHFSHSIYDNMQQAEVMKDRWQPEGR